MKKRNFKCFEQFGSGTQSVDGPSHLTLNVDSIQINLLITAHSLFVLIMHFMMVLGDRDLLLILAFFTIVMYGESRGN